MEVQISGSIVQLKKEFAEGGEAHIYQIGKQTVAKVYKLPSDPEFSGDETARAAARIRLVVAQRKLPLIPRDMPVTVAAPIALVHDPASGFIIGYTMPLIRARCTLGDLHVTEKEVDDRKVSLDPVSDRDVVRMFSSLKDSVQALHERGMVIGDFNDRNVLVTDDAVAYIIDIDSAQFAPFRTKVFTPEFVDPHLCCLNPATEALELTTTHTTESDWYAWWVMLFEAVYLVNPYGGIYKPADKTKKIAHNLRGLKEHHISVYHPEVVFPQHARAFTTVPEILNKYFRMVFADGLRVVPPDILFQSLRFDPSGNFDVGASIVTIVQHASTAPKQLASKVIFEGERIVACAEHDGDMHFLELKNSTLYRNHTRLTGITDTTGLQFYLAGAQTAIVKHDQAVVLSSAWPTKIAINLASGTQAKLPLVAGSESGLVFYDGAFKLLCGTAKPLVRILDIEPGLGPLGAWAQGEYLSVLFVRGGKLGYLVHHLTWDTTVLDIPYAYVLPTEIEAIASYGSSERAWLFITTSSGTLCTVFDLRKKTIAMHLEMPRASVAPWMENIHNKCAIGTYLFSPTHEGISRFTANIDGSVNTKLFPTADDLSGSTLYAMDKTLFTVSKSRLLQMG